MRPRKRFGQHFLEDEAVLQQIVAAVAPRPDDQLLEIGPGSGALTELLYGRTRRFVAVEIDRDLAPGLAARFPALELVNADILKLDIGALLDGDGWRLVGNLPYNISTPLLVRLLDSSVRDMHFMLQREVAARLGAEPGSKAWGRLSVITQYHCTVEVLFDVSPDSFRPPPKVWSAVVRLVPRGVHARPAALDRVLRLAFSARRKRIANALKSLDIHWDELSVPVDARADDLGVEDYVALASAIDEEAG